MRRPFLVDTLATLATLAVLVGGPGQAAAQPTTPTRVPEPVEPPPAPPPPGLRPTDAGPPRDPAPAQPPAPLEPPAPFEPPAPALPLASVGGDALDPDASAGTVAATLGLAFGPVITVDDIVVSGNRTTSARVIERALPVARGDVLRTGDPRLTQARWKLLALGYFREVTIGLRKGRQRGHVILAVDVDERGTVALNRLWFGTSAVAPWWLGADVADRNFAGTGVGVAGAFAYVSGGAVTGARAQWAGELRLATPNLGGTRWGGHAAVTGQRGSEAVRVSGPSGSADPADLAAFDYQRVGVRAGPNLALTALTALTGELRLETIDAATATVASRVLPDGTVTPIDVGLRPGTSRVVSLAVGLTRDTRPDPALPHAGSRLELSAELGSSLVGGSYDFAVVLGRYDRFWPVARRHAIGLHLAGGVVLGDAPRFDRLHVADVDRMLPPRVLGMTTAVTPPLRVLSGQRADALYGELGGNALGEYVYQWWRRPNRIYGGDLFIAAGLWTLTATDRFGADEHPVGPGLPIDVIVDAGLRIDTEIGVFEFSISNALGRVPRW